MSGYRPFRPAPSVFGWEGVVIALLVGACAWAIWIQHCEYVEMEDYVRENNCVEFGRMSAGYKTSAKTGYRCPNGREIWL